MVTYRTNVRACSGRNIAVHVNYTTHIASFHYIDNFSTYVVSHRHLYITYNDTSLHKRREVKISKDQCQQKTPPLSGMFERSHRIFHAHRKETQTSREMCPGTSTGSNREKPTKKSAPSAVATGYVNRPATAAAITTVLRCMHRALRFNTTATQQHVEMPRR